MFIKIVRQDRTIFQECTRFELKRFEGPEYVDMVGDGSSPESVMDIYTKFAVSGVSTPSICTDSEPIYKGNVVYIENDYGQTIEQLHW